MAKNYTELCQEWARGRGRSIVGSEASLPKLLKVFSMIKCLGTGRTTMNAIMLQLNTSLISATLD